MFDSVVRCEWKIKGMSLIFGGEFGWRFTVTVRNGFDREVLFLFLKVFCSRKMMNGN